MLTISRGTPFVSFYYLRELFQVELFSGVCPALEILLWDDPESDLCQLFRPIEIVGPDLRIFSMRKRYWEPLTAVGSIVTAEKITTLFHLFLTYVAHQAPSLSSARMIAPVHTVPAMSAPVSHPPEVSACCCRSYLVRLLHTNCNVITIWFGLAVPALQF